MCTKNISFLLVETGLMCVVESADSLWYTGLALYMWEREKHRAMEVKAESQSPTAAHTSCLPPCLRHTHTHIYTGVSYTFIKAAEVFEIALLVLISSPCISSGSLLSHFYFCLHSIFFFWFSYFVRSYLLCLLLSVLLYIFYHSQAFSFFSLSSSRPSLQSCCWLCY